MARVFYTDEFVLPLPEGHRFPMARYRLLRERLIERGIVSLDDLAVPPAATDDELRLVHDAGYVARVTSGTLADDEQRRIGFPWSPKMVERSRRSVGATIAAARIALVDGLGINLAGGTHHAAVDRGGGYCVFNDVAVAIRVLQRDRALTRAVVIDADVHHGDGTASIFAGDPTVFTFSIHARKAYPSRKPPSSLDVALEPGADDATYLDALSNALARVAASGPFDMAFYLAGADPFAGDTLGGLALTKTGLAERDRRVLQVCRGLGWPIVITMAGGYAADINDIVDIQCETVRLAMIDRAAAVG
jgi:acetoin utilization deacetylase AcuC-like enzyme